VHLML